MGRQHTTDELMVFRWSWFVKPLNAQVIVQLKYAFVTFVLGEGNEYEIAVETAKKKGQWSRGPRAFSS